MSAVTECLSISLNRGVAVLVNRRMEEQLREYSTYSNGDEEGKIPRRKRIRPSGPWQVQIMSTLPLKALSRVWGWFNELDIPYYLRIPGFRLYSFIFGVK